MHHVTLQIPISTLTAVSTLLQSTRPIMQRPLFQQYTNNLVQTPAPVTVPVFAAQGAFLGRQTFGARVAQLKPAADGSSFKIWSNVDICKYNWYLKCGKSLLRQNILSSIPFQLAFWKFRTANLCKTNVSAECNIADGLQLHGKWAC